MYVVLYRNDSMGHRYKAVYGAGTREIDSWEATTHSKQFNANGNHRYII